MRMENLYIKYGHNQLIGDDLISYASDEQLQLIYSNLTNALVMSPKILISAKKNPNNDFGTITLLEIILCIENEVMRSNIDNVRREILKRY